jgi:hypothetical protein
MAWTNHDSLHRHTCHAYEDFRELRKILERFSHTFPEEQELWHSLSHHLRHAVFRSGHEVKQPRMDSVRRSHVDKSHR